MRLEVRLLGGAASRCCTRKHLGSDAGIILWRRILARELAAIAQGRPTKKWRVAPAEVLPTLGV
jgi:hypothetical protein